MKRLTHVLLLFLFVACNNEAATENETADNSNNKAFGEFSRFYKAFHQDSLFQIEHIQFPLQGIPSNADSAMLADRSFRWQKSDWIMHKPIDPDGEFKQSFLPVDDELIIENIMHQSGQFAIERRFAKMGEKWMLIYYAGINSVKQ